MDFSGASTLDVATLIVDPGVSVSIINWVDTMDRFCANTDWPGASFDTRGTTLYNQITFDGFTNDETVWHGFDKQIPPVPEPRTSACS